MTAPRKKRLLWNQDEADKYWQWVHGDPEITLSERAFWYYEEMHKDRAFAGWLDAFEAAEKGDHSLLISQFRAGAHIGPETYKLLACLQERLAHRLKGTGGVKPPPAWERMPHVAVLLIRKQEYEELIADGLSEEAAYKVASDGKEKREDQLRAFITGQDSTARDRKMAAEGRARKGKSRRR